MISPFTRSAASGPMVLAFVVPLQLWDLDADDGGLLEAGTTGQWAWGIPTSGPAESANGRVWGTVLDGVHLNDTTDTLEIPLPDLSGAVAPVLVVSHWYEILAGDAGTFEVDDGTGWATVDPVYGYPVDAGFVGDSGGWVDTSIDLAGWGSTPRFRLVFTADDAVAGDGWYLGDIGLFDGDATPPQVSAVEVPTDTQDLDGPYTIRLAVDDDIGVTDVTAHVRVDDGIEVAYPLSDGGDGTWFASLPGQAPGSVVTWYAEAEDLENVARWPETGEERFRVFLAAPTELSGPSGRAAQWADLTWLPPGSPHTVLRYRLWEEGRESTAVEVANPPAEVQLVPGGTGRWLASAVYDVGEGDASEAVDLDLEIPELTSLQPQLGFPGDRLYVEVTGRSLYLLAGVTEVDLGSGIVVESVDVHDVNEATLDLTLSDSAAAGPRDLRVSGGQGEWSFPSAFRVGEGGDRPHIDVVEPDGVVQGRSARVIVRATSPFAGALQVLPADDLIVTSDVVVDANVASFELLADLDALPGPRTVVLDDGARLWPFTFSVREYVEPPDGFCGCGVSGIPALPGVLLVGILVVCRRRRPEE